MRRTILYGWNFMRILRLVLGGIVLWQSFVTGDLLPGIAGGMIMAMAVLNIGCCGLNGCSTGSGRRPAPAAATEDIHYEEVEGRF